MSSSQVVLKMENITKSFPGVKALDGVSLYIKAGAVHALMGENGAGKSTLMKCAFGLYHPDAGNIFIDDEEVHLMNARNAMDKGIAMIHQELHPVKTRNVMENIWIGRIPYRKKAGIKWVDEKKMYQDTKKLFQDLGIDINPKQMVGELSVSHCQLLEIARAVSYNAKVIIMDEPTSSLTDTEAELLFQIIHKLLEKKVAIIYISHKIEEILQISDEVTIMRDGKLVGCWPAEELTMEMIVNKMVGREMTQRFPDRKHIPGKDYLIVKNLTSAEPNSFKTINFTLKKGEILGVGGLVGAQRTELMEAIFGLRPIKEGSITIDGKETNIKSPQDAIKHGMALLTEERRATGIIPMLSVMENIVISNQTANHKSYKSGLFLNEKKRKDDAQKYVDFLSIKTPSVKSQIVNLSGGNQQKALLGRWLLMEPEILILDEPTRGIDVGAKYEIYCLMEEMASQGKCVIMISSEMPELLGMADRVLVMCEGHLSGILDHNEISDKKIMYLASTHNTTKGE